MIKNKISRTVTAVRFEPLVMWLGVGVGKMNDEALILIANTLIKKYGKEKIEKLLSDELTIDINVARLREGRQAYIRDLKHNKTPFTDFDGREINVDLLLIALEDAGNIMSYSNWANDKFDRAAECVIRYCEEHNIPITYKTITQNYGRK